MEKLVVAVGVLWWMLCGSAITLAFMARRGKRLYERHELYAPYAELLGKECSVRSRYAVDRWLKCRVVAVSHKGAVNVRVLDDDGARAFWVPANKVDEMVRFEGAFRG